MAEKQVGLKELQFRLDKKVLSLDNCKKEISANSSSPLLDAYEIPDQMVEKATKHYAKSADINSVIGICDTSIFSDGKEGFLFTDTKVYYKDVFGKPKKLWYTGIISTKTCFGISLWKKHR